MSATLELVASRGFDATPVTAIEEAAGLIPGNGSFYRHFASKQEALARAVDQEVTRIRNLEDQPVINANNEGRQSKQIRVRDHFLRDLDQLKAMRNLILILARDRERLPEVVKTIRQTLLDTGLVGYSELFDGSTGVEVSPVGVVILSALVGYHLSSEYFGAPPGNVDPKEFASILADLAISRAGNA